MSNNSTMVKEALSAIEGATIDRELKLNQLKQTPVVQEELSASVDTAQEQEVQAMVSKLMNVDFSDGTVRDGVEQGLRKLGDKVMDEAAQFTSEAMNKRMGNLKGTEEGDVVYETMINLNDKIKEIHPSQFDLAEKWFHKILPFLSPVRSYFQQFQTMGSVINGYQKTLETGIKERELDLDILRQDKQSLYKSEKVLRSAIEFNKLLQENLETQIKMEVADPEQKQFLEGQILHGLIRQTQGYEEMRAVNLQGQMSIEMLLKTGLEVIDGAKRCTRISVNALTIAGVVQQVLTGQRKLLEAVNAINQTATEMVDWNAKQLNTTMMEVGKAAMETSIDIDVLTNAIESSVKAIDEDIKFRQESIPLIKERVSRLNAASSQAQATTQKLAKERKTTENYSKEASDIFANV